MYEITLINRSSAWIKQELRNLKELEKQGVYVCGYGHIWEQLLKIELAKRMKRKQLTKVELGGNL